MHSMRVDALSPFFRCSGCHARRLEAMLDKSEIRFLPVGGRRVAYEMRGDGPPLVAPAWWVSHLELDWQSAGFRRFWEGIADGYTLIRYDRLGVGMSDRTVRDSDLTLDGEVAMLCALLDELELERVSLIGGSSGSCTAIAFAAAYPERVERLVLYGSYPDGAAITSSGRGPSDPGGGTCALGTRFAPAQRHLPRWCRLCGAGTLRTVAAGFGDLRDRCRIVDVSSIASTSATSFPSSARRRWWCIGATTVRCRTGSGVRSRPRFQARHSSRCRAARTSLGTATPNPSYARVAKCWHRRSGRRTKRAGPAGPAVQSRAGDSRVRRARG